MIIDLEMAIISLGTNNTRAMEENAMIVALKTSL